MINYFSLFDYRYNNFYLAYLEFIFYLISSLSFINFEAEGKLFF